MSILAQKLATLRRVARTGGVRGVLRTAAWSFAPPIPGYGPVARLAASASVLPAVTDARRRHGRPPRVLAFFGGIGDELLLTAVVGELRRRDVHGTWIMSEHPDLWRHNAGRDVILPWDRRHATWAEAFGWNAIFPHYSRYEPEHDRDVAPSAHVIRVMCERVGIVGPIARKPRVVLTAAEEASGALVENQVVIQSAGLHARFPVYTKQWFPDRFQQVVDALKGDVNFVQVGSPADPPLAGAVDLRGQTSLRETAAILSRSLAFVGQVGMSMHLARAVDCRAAIVYGGREHPSQSGYSCNENLYAPVPCSPCWRVNSCPYDRACMREISATDVVRAVRHQLARRGQPLAVDTDVIPADPSLLGRAADGRPLVRVRDIYGVARDVEAFLPLGTPGAAPARRLTEAA